MSIKTKIQNILNQGALTQRELVQLAVTALQDAGVRGAEDPDDAVIAAISMTSSYEFELDESGDLIVC